MEGEEKREREGQRGKSARQWCRYVAYTKAFREVDPTEGRIPAGGLKLSSSGKVPDEEKSVAKIEPSTDSVSNSLIDVAFDPFFLRFTLE